MKKNDLVPVLQLHIQYIF